MLLSILVPSAISQHFAKYTDTYLTATEDWRLVFHQRNATSPISFSREVQNRVKQTVALIFMSSACADPRSLPKIMRQQGFEFMSNDTDYDLWSFDLNPCRLVDSIDEVLSLLGGLGCYWALHTFNCDNPRYKMWI